MTCGREPIDQLYLWLATSLDWFGLLASSRSETAAALVRPIWALSNPTLVGEDSFAYLTLRDTDLVTGHVEFGAYAHGPQAAELAEALVGGRSGCGIATTAMARPRGSASRPPRRRSRPAARVCG